MPEELSKSAGISADVILEFDQSIKNITAFGSQMELLDSRFGSLESRIDSMKNSLTALSAYTSKSTGSNLRKQLESELNNLVSANGIALAGIGSAPLKIKQETVRNLFARVDAELNRAVLKQIGNINVKIDPSLNTGAIPIGKDEFDTLNKEIVRLVQTQVNSLVNSIKKSGQGAINESTLSGLSLDISKSTVKEILLSVRDQIKPLLLNPKVDIDGQSFTLTQKDLTQMTNKIKAKVKEALEVDINGTMNKGNNVDAEILKTTHKIDTLVEDYVKNMRGGMEKIDPKAVEIPLKNLSKRLQKYIADEMNVSVKELESLGTIDNGSASGYELKRQFESLEKTVNSKLSSGTSKLITELRQSVRQVEIQPDASIKHYLINEINKLNNDIVKKIRESIDRQFTSMRGEISSVNTDPREINRNARVRNMTSGNTYNTTTIHNNGGGSSQGSQNSPTFNDPYTRRDSYFNGFGLEGAVTNTIRHVAAGSLVGAPMMAMFQAFETFKTSQQEQLKVLQNLSLKDDYRNKVTGDTNYGAVNTDINKLMPKVKQMSNLYGLDYGQMSQVTSVASRLTNNTKETQQFTDQAAKIYRLDNESDLVGTIAPGLEAIMAQFKLSVWDLDKVVNSFAVATNVTKASSDEVMKAMTRSGSALNASGVSAEQAIALNAIAIQRTGQSGENVGNMFKTLSARVTLPQVVDTLKGYGVNVYDTDANGIKKRRSLIDILSNTAQVTKSKSMGDDGIAKIMLGEGGGYQYSKVMSFIEDMHKAGINGGDDLNFYKIMQDIKSFEKDPNKLAEMLSNTMNAPTVTMEKAGVELNNALVSVLEAMNPEIQSLATGISNLSEGITKHADLIAQLIHMTANAAVGFGAMYGARKLGEMGNYNQMYTNAQMEKRYFGGDTLSGRQVYGATNFLNNHVVGDSRDMRNKLNDKNFYQAAMQNDSLKGYFEELANLDNDRRRELRQYVKDSGSRPSNLADMMMMMDESRGYRRQPTKDLTDDEVHQRSSYNARSITETRSVRNVFNESFAQNLLSDLADREKFNNLDETHRGAANRLAGMSDTGRKDFTSFLDEHYNSTGRTISDVTELNKALDEYEQHNRSAVNSTRRSSDAYRDLSRAITSVAQAAEGTRTTGMERFMGFVDTIPQRARGALGALTNVAKGIGDFAKQLAIAMAVGDVLSSNANAMSMTPTQMKIANAKNSTTDAAKAYSNYQQSSLGSKALKTIGLFWNGAIDAATDGNAKVDPTDMMGFKMNFEKWLAKTYGTGNPNKALTVANKQAKKKDKYAEDVTLDDLTNKYLDSSGANAKLQKLQTADFVAQYKQYAISKSEQDKRQRAAENARKTWENQMYADGQLQYFSFDDMKTRVQEGQKTAKTQGDTGMLNAVLGGTTTDSRQYLNLQVQSIESQRQAYKDEMTSLNSFINDQQTALKYLEDNGKAYTTDKKGNRVETADYQKSKQALGEANDKKKQMQDEFGVQDKQWQLDEQTMKVQWWTNDTSKSFSRAQAQKQYKDAINSITMNTESPKYIDSQISSSSAMIGTMKSSLAKLEAQNLRDPNNELQDSILGLKNQIASAQVEVKNLRLQRLQAWKTGFSDNMDNIDIKYLQQEVALGPGVSSDSPIMRDLRIRQLQDQKSNIDSQLGERKAQLNSGVYAKGSNEFSQIMKDIRDLTKQSLQAQLGINEQLKQSLGGTFNLPDGVKVMSQYDYMASKGNYSNMTVQAGDTYVNITLPNVTGKTGSAQLATMGQQIGQGIAQGRAGSLRTQLFGVPFGYKTY